MNCFNLNKLRERERENLQINERRKTQIRTKGLTVNKLLLKRMLVYGQPLLKSSSTMCLNDPYTAIVTLDHGPSVFRPPDSPGDSVIQIQPLEHGFLKVADGQPFYCIAAEEVESSEVVKLHGQVHVCQLVTPVTSCHGSRNHR